MKYYRAFTEEFCRHLADHTAWPPIKAAQKWFADDIGGIQTKRYKLLKDGQALDERYAYSLIRMFQAAAAKATLRHETKVLAEFLRLKGVANSAAAKVEEIAAHVCGPRLEHAAASNDAIDFLQIGLSAIGEVFNTRRQIDRLAQNCSTNKLLWDAATWLYVTGGRLTKKGSANMRPEEALVAAHKYIGISRDEYAHRMRRWHAFNPWTVVLGRGYKHPNALSVVLPLSDNAYDELVSGRRPSYDCHPELLTVPSRTILLEVITERPRDLGAERSNPFRPMYAIILSQIAVFLGRLDPEKAETIRLLSYADMPLYVKRLKSFGFRPTRHRMHTTGLPFFEKTITTKTAFGSDAVLLGVFRQLAEVLDSPPPD